MFARLFPANVEPENEEIHGPEKRLDLQTAGADEVPGTSGRLSCSYPYRQLSSQLLHSSFSPSSKQSSEELRTRFFNDASAVLFFLLRGIRFFNIDPGVLRRPLERLPDEFEGLFGVGDRNFELFVPKSAAPMVRRFAPETQSESLDEIFRALGHRLAHNYSRQPRPHWPASYCSLILIACQHFAVRITTKSRSLTRIVIKTTGMIEVGCSRMRLAGAAQHDQRNRQKECRCEVASFPASGRC